MDVSFNIGSSHYLIDIDNYYAEILLTEYTSWFTRYDNETYKILFHFKRENKKAESLLKFYGLREAEIIGGDGENTDLMVKENNRIYINTHLFHNERVYMSLDLSMSQIYITYFTDLSHTDLMALIKTAFICANNYLLEKFVFLAHASALEIDKKTAMFIGASGAGKTTIAEYGYKDGLLVLSDETVLLWKENGGYCVQGTPWHGSEKSIIGSGKKSVLKAIYILYKHQEDFCKESISSYENICAILNQWLNCAQFNMEKLIQGTEFVVNLVQDVKIYKLFFTKSKRFLSVIRNQGGTMPV